MKILIAAIVVLIVFTAFRFFVQEKPGTNDMTVTELKEKLASGKQTIVLDVRTNEEVTGPMPKIKSALHIPLHELQGRLKELDSVKTAEIAVICRSGNRSRAATKILLESGFTAKNVLGGMNAFTRE